MKWNQLDKNMLHLRHSHILIPILENFVPNFDKMLKKDYGPNIKPRQKQFTQERKSSRQKRIPERYQDNWMQNWSKKSKIS